MKGRNRQLLEERMDRPKYPNRITVCMTDKMLQELRSTLYMRSRLGDIARVDTDSLLLHIIQAFDEQESGPIFLRSVKEE